MTRGFALRVDIDTVGGLVDGVPSILELCNELGLRATFFVTVGVDTAARTFFRQPEVKRHKAINPLKKYGIKEILGSLKGLQFSARAEKIKAIQESGHEVQLHCYDHVEWVKKIRGAKPKEAEEMIARGMKAFEEMLGRRPEAFASPAFLVTDAVLDAEERLGFLYASDYTSEGDCVPFTRGERSVLQIPVNAPLIEDLVAGGMRDGEIRARIGKVIRNNSITVMYVHASYEPRLKRTLLSSILLDALEIAQSLTFEEIFETWNR